MVIYFITKLFTFVYLLLHLSILQFVKSVVVVVVLWLCDNPGSCWACKQNNQIKPDVVRCCVVGVVVLWSSGGMTTLGPVGLYKINQTKPGVVVR